MKTRTRGWSCGAAAQPGQSSGHAAAGSPCLSHTLSMGMSACGAAAAGGGGVGSGHCERACGAPTCRFLSWTDHHAGAALSATLRGQETRAHWVSGTWQRGGCPMRLAGSGTSYESQRHAACRQTSGCLPEDVRKVRPPIAIVGLPRVRLPGTIARADSQDAAVVETTAAKVPWRSAGVSRKDKQTGARRDRRRTGRNISTLPWPWPAGSRHPSGARRPGSSPGRRSRPAPLRQAATRRRRGAGEQAAKQKTAGSKVPKRGP